MSDVTEAPSATAANQAARPLQGSNVWYELMTTDPDGAAKFYGSVVPGWTIGSPIGGGQDYRMIGRGDGGFAGGVLSLSESDCAEGARPIWLGYIGVDDVDATVADVEKLGGKTIMAAFDIPQGRIAMVADPQGSPFYLMKPTPPEGNPDAKSDVFSPTEEQRISWNELSTSDPAAARKFYTELFDWDDTDFMDMGEMGEYRFLDHAGTRLGALCGVMPGDQSKWRYYIRVPSVSQAAEAAKSAGGSIAMGPMEVPGGDHIIIGSDPQGAEFALVGKA